MALTTLETPRLRLRTLTVADAEAVFAYASDAEVTRFVRFETHASIEDSREYLRGVEKRAADGIALNWGIELKAEKRLIGSIAFVNLFPQRFAAEVGYVIHRGEWGKGYVAEALRPVCDHGFKELRLKRIEAYVSPANPPSCRVLEKCGFQREGLLRQGEFIKGRMVDSLIYSRLATDK